MRYEKVKNENHPRKGNAKLEHVTKDKTLANVTDLASGESRNVVSVFNPAAAPRHCPTGQNVPHSSKTQTAPLQNSLKLDIRNENICTTDNLIDLLPKNTNTEVVL